MKYVVKKIKHDTGEVFINAKKIKENETYIIIEASNSVELKAKLDSEVKGG